MKQFINNKSLYLLGTDGQIWGFYYNYPDMVGMGECMIGCDNEKKAKEIATECDKELIKELHKYIKDTGCWIKGNHLKMINLLSRMFNLTEDEVKKSLRYNETAIRLTNELDNTDYSTYETCLEHLDEWKGDEERVLKYMKSSLYNGNRWDGVFVDIFPTEEDLARPTWPTESYLLHRFYDCDYELEKFIKEAVAKYPNPLDYDYAGYYVLDKINEERLKVLERIKAKQNKKNNG